MRSGDRPGLQSELAGAGACGISGLRICKMRLSGSKRAWADAKYNEYATGNPTLTSTQHNLVHGRDGTMEAMGVVASRANRPGYWWGAEGNGGRRRELADLLPERHSAIRHFVRKRIPRETNSCVYHLPGCYTREASGYSALLFRSTVWQALMG